MAGVRPRLPEDADLARLLDVKRLARFVFLERGALQVHSQLRRPRRRGVGGRAPPDAIAQSRRMRLEAEQSGRVRKHRPRIGPRETFALQQLEKDFAVTPAQIGVGPTFRRRVAEVTPALDDLL